MGQHLGNAVNYIIIFFLSMNSIRQSHLEDADVSNDMLIAFIILLDKN